MFEFFQIALSNIFQIDNFLLIFLGVALGALVGCLPGLTATMALALLVPFTYSMSPVSGLVMLGGIYMGAIYGGCIAAILVNTPGTPSAIATTFDGFPLTKKGKAEEALMTAAIASTIGGVVGSLALLFLSPPLASIALKFGPPEFFWLSIFGLTVIASLASDSIYKGLVGGMFGLLLSTVGIAPIGGTPRFTFDLYQLQTGVDIIVALIGFFCIPEVLKMVEKRNEQQKVAEYTPRSGVALKTFKELIKKPVLLLRSAIMGSFIGALPGAGGNIAGILSYNEAQRWSKEPEKFGTGVTDGVAASEAANNSEVPGSLIPLLSLGIPGAPPAAVLLGALLLQGIRPGPELYTNHGDITYTFIISLIVGSILLIPVGIYGSRILARLISIPINYLVPLIVFLSVIGSFAIHNNYVEVYIMVLFGLVGYITKKLGFHPGPIVLGLILGPFAENGLVQSMLLAQSSGSIFATFFTRPISVVLIVLSLISASWPLIQNLRKSKKNQGAEA